MKDAGVDYRGPVLLFDGECGLARRLVRVILRKDCEGVLRFAPLQGAFGQAALRARGLAPERFAELIFLPSGVTGPSVPRSDGALAALETLGGRHARLARLERKVPVVIRDFGYRVLVRLHRVIFGIHAPSPAANPDWAHRFLD